MSITVNGLSIDIEHSAQASATKGTASKALMEKPLAKKEAATKSKASNACGVLCYVVHVLHIESCIWICT